MAGYDGRGARFNIVAVEGSDLSFTVTAVDATPAAIDLSAATIVGTIYNGAGAVIDTMTDSVGGAGSNGNPCWRSRATVSRRGSQRRARC